VAIYVQVTKGSTPVIGAHVHAIVTLGTTNWVVPLLDNGASESCDFLLCNRTHLVGRSVCNELDDRPIQVQVAIFNCEIIPNDIAM
jgi:hypothetical protein